MFADSTDALRSVTHRIYPGVLTFRESDVITRWPLLEEVRPTTWARLRTRALPSC